MFSVVAVLKQIFCALSCLFMQDRQLVYSRFAGRKTLQASSSHRLFSVHAIIFSYQTAAILLDRLIGCATATLLPLSVADGLLASFFWAV